MLTKHWLSSPCSPVHGLFQSFHGSGTSSLLLLDCWCLTALMNGESRSSVSGFIWSAVTAGQCVYLLSRTGVCNNTLYLVLLRLWLCSKWNTYCVKLHTLQPCILTLILTFANPVKRVKDVKIMADITDEKKSGCWLILDGFYAIISWSRWETKPANYQLDQAGRPY